MLGNMASVTRVLKKDASPASENGPVAAVA